MLGALLALLTITVGLTFWCAIFYLLYSITNQGGCQ